MHHAVTVQLVRDWRLLLLVERQLTPMEAPKVEPAERQVCSVTEQGPLLGLVPLAVDYCHPVGLAGRCYPERTVEKLEEWK
jgi:hypothetical protein